MPTLFWRECEITVDRIRLGEHRAAFTVRKTLKPEPNQLTLAIWNLSPDNRASLAELRPRAGSTRGIPVKIRAGYRDAMSLLWLGDLRTCVSAYDSGDWVTTLESGDGEQGTKNGRVSVSMGPRTDVGTALRAAAKALGVGSGNIEQAALRLRLTPGGSQFASGRVLHGPASRVLTDIADSAGLEWSVQDGALQFLDRGKALASTAVLLSSETGLIGSPTVSNDGELSAECLMIPDLNPGRIAVVASKGVQGAFRLTDVTWSGDTWSGDWKASLKGERYA